MATKRPAPEERETRQQQPWKRRKPNNEHSLRPNHGKDSFKKSHAVNQLKNTVRSVRRLLERSADTLPANVRVEKERELQTAQRELERAERAKKRSEIIGRWHKVRFFERQKAERRLKKARKEGDEEGVRVGEVDVNYAVFFPLEREYVSLFPTRGKEVEEGGERRGDREMWELVRRCMEEGTLEDLREGRLAVKGDGDGDEEEAAVVEKPGSSKTKDKKVKKVDKRRAQEKDAGEESDNESGGGFFE